jgi:hypothetical protein
MLRGSVIAIALAACASAPPQRSPPFASLTGTGAAAPATPADAVGNDKKIVQRHMAAHRDAFRACYERAWEANHALAGRIDTHFVIGLDGHVTDATATGLPEAPDVAPCVVHVLEQVTFPPPKGGTVTVSYPFTFAPP